MKITIIGTGNIGLSSSLIEGLNYSLDKINEIAKN